MRGENGGDYTGETDRMDSWSQVADAGGTGETDRMARGRRSSQKSCNASTDSAPEARRHGLNARAHIHGEGDP